MPIRPVRNYFLVAAFLALAAPLLAQTSQPQLVRKADWDQTVKSAYPRWDRDPKPSIELLRQLAQWFPNEPDRIASLALAVAGGYRTPEPLRFEALQLALSHRPAGDSDARIRLELAKLQGAYCCPTWALMTSRGLATSPAFDEKIRDQIARLQSAWKDNTVNILGTGRSYEAERLFREAEEFTQRKEWLEAARRLVRVATKYGEGYLANPGEQADGSGNEDIIISTGWHARQLLAELAMEHAAEVGQAGEIESPGLSRRAESGDRAALETLAAVFPFTQAGWLATLRLADEDLDAGRPAVAELRLVRAIRSGNVSASAARSPSSVPDSLSRLNEANVSRRSSAGLGLPDALFRLTIARREMGDLTSAGQTLAELSRLAADKSLTVRLGDKTLPIAEAIKLLDAPGATSSPSVVKTQIVSENAGDRLPFGAVVRPRVIFSYVPALFDLDNRTSIWPRYLARPENLPTIDGDRVYFHDSANAWAVDWRAGRMLWHYRSPGWFHELANSRRSFSNQINEAPQTSRGYRVGICGQVLAARFRRTSSKLLFDIRGLSCKDGRALWCTTDQPGLDGLSFASDPVGAHGRFYVLAYTNTHISSAFVVCLDPETGGLLWKTPVASGVDSFAATGLGNFFSAHGGLTVCDGRVYVATDRGSFVALDAIDGSLRWICGSDRIFERHSYWGLNTHTTRADEYVMAERSHSAPVVGKVRSPETRSPASLQDSGSRLNEEAASVPYSEGPAPSGPRLNASVYFISKDHPGVFALDSETGRRLFVELPRTAAEIVGEHEGLMIGAWRSGLFALAGDSGVVAWEYPLPLSPRQSWRSGFMLDGRIYWPASAADARQELLVIDAANGTLVGRVSIDMPEQVSSVRPLPNGELATFVSEGGVDRFVVLGECDGKPVSISSGLQTRSPSSLRDSVSRPNEETAVGRRSGAVASSSAVPPPLPPLRLLWRARISPEEAFNSGSGGYICKVLDGGSGPMLLLAAGSRLQCFRFDAQGQQLWSVPTPPSPRDVMLLVPPGGGQSGAAKIALRWECGVEVFELDTGRRLWGWSSGGGGRDRVSGSLYGVCQARDGVAAWDRGAITLLTDNGRVERWHHAVANNAHQFLGLGTPWGVLIAVRQDPDYSGRSYLELLDEKTGKPIWKHDFDRNSRLVMDGLRVWTATTHKDNRRLAMFDVSQTGVKQIWSREIGLSDRLEFQDGRIIAIQQRRLLTIDRPTGKDLVPPIDLPPMGKGRWIVTGPKLHVYSAPGGYNRQYICAIDANTGKERWRCETGNGNPAISTMQQVLAPGGLADGGGGYFWTHVIRAYLGSLTSLDLETGRPTGAVAIPGRNLWNVDDGLGHLAVQQIDNLLLIESEQGPVVLGSVDVAAPASLEIARECRMRTDPPIVSAQRVEQPPHLDGEFDDWAGARWTTIDQPADWQPGDGGALPAVQRKWNGPDDCSARFAIRHDGQSLFAAIEVRDDDSSPAAGQNDLATPGDSIEIGVSLVGECGSRVDAIQKNHDSNHPDIKVVLTQVGGRPVARSVWFANGSEAAISMRSGRTRYEAAIPIRVGRISPLDPSQLTFSLRVNDCDRGQPKGAMCWAGGLGSTNANAQFGLLALSPLTDAEVVERVRVANLLPDASVSWAMLRQTIDARLIAGRAEDLAAAADDLAAFVYAHPQSHIVSRCLAWHEHLLRLAGEKDAAGKLAQLAARAGVPAIELAEARARLAVPVHVAVCGANAPSNLGLRVRFRGQPGDRRNACGVYWGQFRGWLAGGLVFVGPMPKPAAGQISLAVPVELLELFNSRVHTLSFLNRESNAWWGAMSVEAADGRKSIWIAPDGGTPAPWGGKYEPKTDRVNFAVIKSPGGSADWHGPQHVLPQWTEHGLRPPVCDALSNAKAQVELAGGKLPKVECLAAAWALARSGGAGSQLAMELLTAADDLPEAARFVREFPTLPVVPQTLLWMSIRSGEGRKLADGLIADESAKVPRASARAFYGRLLGGIESWQVVGPFSNEADVALRRTYEPQQRPDLDAVYRQDEQELCWKPAKTEPDGFVDLGRALVAGDFQAGYAQAWVKSPEPMRAWVFVESPNVLSVWVGDELVMNNVLTEQVGRRRQSTTNLKLAGGEPAPVSLNAGWNRILVKTCSRYGFWGFKLRLGDAFGAPLSGLEYGDRPQAAAP